VLQPIAGVAAFVVPGAGALSAGLKVGDTVIKAYNNAPGTTPRQHAKAVAIVQHTEKVAASNHAASPAALNGLTLLNKRAAAMRAARAFRVDAHGYVRLVA
jgi:hypothetical protein